jgi:hypothetical protein
VSNRGVATRASRIISRERQIAPTHPQARPIRFPLAARCAAQQTAAMADRRPSLDSGVTAIDRASSSSINEMSRRLSKTLSIRDGSKVLKITVDEPEPSAQASPTEVQHSNANVGEQQIDRDHGDRALGCSWVGRGRESIKCRARAPIGAGIAPLVRPVRLR